MSEGIAKREPRQIWNLHPNVFFTGLTSLLTDVSSEMVFNLVPLYLTNVLRVDETIVGLVAGVSDGADAIFRMLMRMVQR